MIGVFLAALARCQGTADPSLAENTEEIAFTTLSLTQTAITIAISITANPLPTTIDQEMLDRLEAEKQRDIIIVLCATVIVITIVIVLLCVYYRHRMDDEQNPEYTKAILGDDAFEFSHMETL